MTTCLLTNPRIKQPICLTSQLNTIQEDIARLSGFILQLSDFSDEQLEALGIADQLDSIHRCLNRFEARCMAIQVAAYEDEFVAPVEDKSYEIAFLENNNWTTVRREAKHANKLVSQLTNSLSKIRAGLGEYQNQGAIPEDIVRINQVVGNAVSGLASDCLLDHG
jgi:flagellin-like hook-associated protein FlgL